MKKVLFIVLIGGFLASCTSVKVPQYITVEKLTTLAYGMTKAQVNSTLGIYPFDILMNQKDGCELHLYKYKHPEKKIGLSKMEKPEGLTMGSRRFTKPADAILIFRAGKLETMFTDESKRDLIDLLAYSNETSFACDNPTYGKTYGCTDPASINYNAQATDDDGKCEYCPCGYTKNPNYNPNRKDACEPCVKMEDAGCKTLDMIEKIVEKGNGKVDLYLTVGADNLKCATPMVPKSELPVDKKIIKNK